MNNSEIVSILKKLNDDYIIGKNIVNVKFALKERFKQYSKDEIIAIGKFCKANADSMHKINFKYFLELLREVYNELYLVSSNDNINISIESNNDTNDNSLINNISQREEERTINQPQNENGLFLVEFPHQPQNTHQPQNESKESLNLIDFPHQPQNSFDLSLLNSYNNISQREEERTINQPQNENDKLFDINYELEVDGWNIDKLSEQLTTKTNREQIQIHSVIDNFEYANDRIRNKMILLMRILASMYNAVYEQMEDEAEESNQPMREVNYLEINKSVFDYIDKNNHDWMKDYLSKYGIESKDHSYWSGSSINKYSDKIKACSIKYYFNPSVFTNVKLVPIDKNLAKMIDRVELRRTTAKLKAMKTPHERLQSIGLAWIESKLPSMETVLKSLPSTLSDKTKTELRKYEHILEYGSSLPKMGVWHRVYNSICNIPKFIRKEMHDVVEVDVKACQINLLLWMAYKDGYITYNQYEMYAGDVYSKLCPELIREIVKKEVTEIYLSSSVSAMEKTEIYKVIESKLPALNSYARKLKGGSYDRSYTNLSRRLTQIESSVMFEAMSELNNKGIDCYCLFDAMLCTSETSNIVALTINSIFAKYGIQTYAESK